MSNGHIRAWGYWSQAKLQILDDYLRAFLRASSPIETRIYVDAFAGWGTGRDRATGEEFAGSARIALEAVAGEHRFTKLLFFESPEPAAELERTLRPLYPGRDFTVHPGDCNEQIPQALTAVVTWAPTFAFLDPDGLELAWTTLVALSDHKRGYRTSSKPEYKIELWLLFSTQGLVRTLALDASLLRPADEARATRLYGNEQWRAIYQLRVANQIDASRAKNEYVNLMRWRLSTVLGYRWTHSLELKNLRGGTVYHMLFATDNAAGNTIMEDLYSRAAAAIPQMRQDAVDRASGQLSLIPGGYPEYEPEPPWEPPG